MVCGRFPYILQLVIGYVREVALPEIITATSSPQRDVIEQQTASYVVLRVSEPLSQILDAEALGNVEVLQHLYLVLIPQCVSDWRPVF
jgi:hypothetical protein